MRRRQFVCATALRHAGVLVLLAAISFLASHSARAVPVDFQGPSQDLSLSLTASGNANVSGPVPRSIMLIGLDYAIGNISLKADGFTYDVKNNPATLPVSQKATVTQTTDPRSVGVPPVGKAYLAPNTDLGFTGAELTSATGLHLDLLNGASLGFELNTLSVPRTQMFYNESFYTYPPPLDEPEYYPGAQSFLKVNLSGTINALYIEQDATKLPAFLSDGPGTGTFAIPSILHAALTDTPMLGGFTLATFESERTANFTLTGRYNVSGPPGKATLELHGELDTALPLNNMNLTTALYTTYYQNYQTHSNFVYQMTNTFDLTGAALNFALNYHLTTLVAIPEPGSVLLLAIGLMSLAPLALRRVRR